MIKIILNNASVIQQFHNFIWGWPLIILIMIVGLWLTIILKGIQIRKLPLALKCMLKEEKNEKGEVTAFQALCISMSATIGTGNITGVAAAISIGGAGALLWMMVTAFLGMATKYAEGFLSIKYRRIEQDKIIGGPYAYIEYGMGYKWKPLAKIFAIFGALSSILGVGTLTQINGITDATKNVFDNETLYLVNIFGNQISIISLIIGLLIAMLTAIILIGGVKRVGKVCEYLVPIMAGIYILICIIIIFNNIKILPVTIITIIKTAFKPNSLIGGVVGITIRDTVQQGVSKGILSNEAGLGSAPIATAVSKVSSPVKQGLISMTSTFFGTIIICSLTGIVIVITNAFKQELVGISITDYAFSIGLPFNKVVSSILLLLSITCFAFTSIIGWNFYGIKCLDYLTHGNEKVMKIYQWIYIMMVFIGSFLEVNLIWNIAEILNAFMAIPNLFAILYLSKDIADDTNQILKNEKDLDF